MTTDITTLAIALETSSAIAQIQQLTSRLDSLRSQSIRLRNADPFPAMGRNVSAFNSTASRTSAVMKGITAAASKLTAVLAGVFAVSKIVAFGNESIRVFSDLKEETQKFGVVFSGMGKQAEKVVKELQESYGQSELSARRSLALTGDLLTGFGFDRKTALDMSEQVAKLGADIASFSNYAGGAEGAVAALTKGLLGETESMKMLGIAIRQDSDEFKNMVANIRTSTGASEAQAKAQAVLKLAYAQSGNAIGDFKRNMDSIANQSRVFGNSMLDLKSAVGGFLDELFHIAPLVGSLGEKVRSLSETIKANAGEWAATIHLSMLRNSRKKSGYGWNLCLRAYRREFKTSLLLDNGQTIISGAFSPISAMWDLPPVKICLMCSPMFRVKSYQSSKNLAWLSGTLCLTRRAPAKSSIKHSRRLKNRQSGTLQNLEEKRK